MRGAELVSEQIEYAKDRIGISGRVGHDFCRLKFGLLLQNDGEEAETVAQGTGNGHGVEAGKLV